LRQLNSLYSVGASRRFNFSSLSYFAFVLGLYASAGSEDQDQAFFNGRCVFYRYACLRHKKLRSRLSSTQVLTSGLAYAGRPPDIKGEDGERHVQSQSIFCLPLVGPEQGSRETKSRALAEKSPALVRSHIICEWKLAKCEWGPCAVSTNANKNGFFRKFLIRGTTIANDVDLRCWESKAATGVGSVVKVTSTTHASEANKIGAISD
jgi:hypothetical protein